MLNIWVCLLQSCRLQPHQSSLPTLFPQEKEKSELVAEGGVVHVRKKEKKKDLAAPAVSETFPLPSYNKQEKQNQNTAPMSPSNHPVLAVLLPATAHKQSHCETPLAHPSRWPEQQKSPAQEACISYMQSLNPFQKVQGSFMPPD